MIDRKKTWVGIVALFVCVFVGAVGFADEGPGGGPASAEVDKQIAALRDSLVTAFNSNDMDGLLAHLSPDAIVTWQDGTVCRGPEAVRAYHLEKMQGENAVVSKVVADPVVDGRQIHGDWAVSYGRMNDHFFFTDGTDVALDSRFTATISREGDRWVITAVHFSTNAFDNPILHYVGKQGFKYGALAGGVAGLIVGLILAAVFLRRGRAQAA